MGGRRLLPRDLPRYDRRAFGDLLQEFVLRNPKRAEALKPLLIHVLEQEDAAERARFFQLFRVKATAPRS
jgi:hypothetical protein